MNRHRHRLDDVLALLLLIGVPVALCFCSSNPFSQRTSLDQLSTVLTALIWLVWLYCVFDVAASGVAQLRSGELLNDAPRSFDRIGAMVAGFALVTASLIPGFNTAAGAASKAPVHSAPDRGTPSARAVAKSTNRPPSPRATYIVQAGDCLWDIAARVYGDPLEWTTIARANLGHLMNDGRLFINPSLIYVGWQLQIPPAPTMATPLVENNSPTSSIALHAKAPQTSIQASPAANHASKSSSVTSKPRLTPQGPQSQPTSSALGWWLLGPSMASLLGVGLLARRSRRNRKGWESNHAIDAAIALGDYPAEALVSLTERAVLLAWRDGVLTTPCVMEIMPEGARVHIEETTIWTASPIDLSAPCEAPRASPGFILTLDDSADCMRLLIVPQGCCFRVGGSGSERFVKDALSLQREFLWGMWNHLEDSEEELDLDQLALRTRGSDVGAATVVAVDEGDDCDLDLGIFRRGDDAATTAFDALRKELQGPPRPDIHITAVRTPPHLAEPEVCLVRLLTPEPRIDGLSHGIEDARRRRVTELVAYLCLHRDEPPTADRLRTRVLGTTQHDAAAKTLFNIVSASRRALGQSGDGNHLLPSVGRDGRYRISPLVHSDVELFLSLVRHDETPQGDQLNSYARAFDLIEGEPLSACLTGYGWMSAEGLRSGFELAVESATRDALGLCFAHDALDLATTFLERAQLVCLYSEDLCLLAMRVAAARGSRSSLRHAYLELARIKDSLDPGTEPSVHHEALYRSLLSRLDGDQASFAAMDAAPRNTSPSAPAAL